ncbi:MAG: oligosaccharide flippase family protein [Erythrobacter sp.]|nr:oligosaccharide flippase family protein [Erythrobacter sp.]
MTADSGTSDSPPATAAPAKSVGHRLASGLAWSSIGAFGWRALTAISSVMVARFLTPAGFGELGVVRSTANLFTVYAGFRLGTTATKHLAEYKDTEPERAGRILRMALVMSAVFCALTAAVLILGGGWLAVHQLNNPDIAWPLRISGVFLFFQAYSSVRETILIGVEDFKAFARVNVVKGALTALLTVPGAWFWGVIGASAGLALSAFLTYLVLQFYVKRALDAYAIDENQPFSAWKSELPLLWTFALPGILVGVVSATTLWWGRTVLTGTPDGYVQLGLFEAANQWRTMILFLPAILARVSMPVLSETFGRPDKEDFRAAVVLQFRAMLLITLPLTVVVIAAADLLMIVFGRAYADSGMILPLLMVSVFAFALNQALRKVQDGTGKIWENFAMQVAWAVAFVVVLLVPAGPVDAVRLAWAFLASELVMALLQFIYVEVSLARGTLVKMLPDVAVSAVAIAVAVYANSSHLGLWQHVLLSFVALAISIVPAALIGQGFIRAQLARRRKRANT